MKDLEKKKEKDAGSFSENLYKQKYYDWPLERMAKTLKENLR